MRKHVVCAGLICVLQAAWIGYVLSMPGAQEALWKFSGSWGIVGAALLLAMVVVGATIFVYVVTIASAVDLAAAQWHKRKWHPIKLRIFRMSGPGAPPLPLTCRARKCWGLLGTLEDESGAEAEMTLGFQTVWQTADGKPPQLFCVACGAEHDDDFKLRYPPRNLSYYATRGMIPQASHGTSRAAS
jgi:hypothetical protein